MWDFYCRRQREFYVDFLHRHPRKKRLPRRWHRDETYHRYRDTAFGNQNGSVSVNTVNSRSNYPKKLSYL